MRHNSPNWFQISEQINALKSSQNLKKIDGFFKCQKTDKKDFFTFFTTRKKINENYFFLFQEKKTKTEYFHFKKNKTPFEKTTERNRIGLFKNRKR